MSGGTRIGLRGSGVEMDVRLTEGGSTRIVDVRKGDRDCLVLVGEEGKGAPRGCCEFLVRLKVDVIGETISNCTPSRCACEPISIVCCDIRDGDVGVGARSKTERVSSALRGDTTPS